MLSADMVGLSWLVRLRWLTLAAQCLALAVAWLNDDRRLALPLVFIVGLALSNVGLALTGRRLGSVWTLRLVLIADTVVLTALLHTTGGPMNPFTALYFVQITFAAVVLSTRWVLAVLLLSLLGYAVLFWDYGGGHLRHADMEAHLRGMWIAFAASAALIGFSVSRLTAERARRQEELTRERERAAKNLQAAAMTSLAAGAAHELGSPIGTMVIAASELATALEGSSVAKEILEDVQLIRSEGRRCREVLDSLSEAGGALRGESFTNVSLGEMLEIALGPLGEDRRRVSAIAASDVRAWLPTRAVGVAVRNLVANALQASAKGQRVEVSLDADAGALYVEVRDHGVGMDEQLIERVTDPYFTTRDGGLGLGLFLVETLAEQLGGELELRSVVGEGTTARLILPREMRGLT